MIEVHVLTVEIVTALTFATIAGTLAWTWRTQRLSGALAWWSVCFAFAAVHMVLLLRGIATASPIAIFMDEFALIFAAFAMWFGFRIFEGKRILWAPYVITSALYAAIAALAGLSPPDMAKLGYLIAGVLAIVCAVEAARSRRASTGWQITAIVLLLIHGAVLTVRTVLQSDTVFGDTLDMDEALQVFFIMEPMVLPVVLGYTLLGLTYEHERSVGMIAQRTDTLTGLLNRRGLSHWTQRASRTQPHGVIALDIDRFKAINDTHGHTVGDEVLTAIAGRIQSAQRDTDAMARIGGEEFIIVTPGGSTEEAAEVAERLRAALEREPVDTTAGAILVTASFGVVSLPASWSAGDFERALHAADKALYEAKRNGRNTVRVAAVELF